MADIDTRIVKVDIANRDLDYSLQCTIERITPELSGIYCK